MNIANNLVTAATHFPENIALIDGRNCLTYLELDNESNFIASALEKIGVNPGDHVALCAPNSYSWIAFYYGVLKSGAVAITLPYAMTRNELLPVLDDCKPKVIFTIESKLSDFDKKYYLKKIICDNGDISYSNLLLKGDIRFEIIDRNPDETAAILYTGGTTGMPKGVMLSHGNIIASAHNVAYYEHSNENDRALCFLPLNHVFAQMHILNSAIYSAGGLVILPSFDMEFLLDAIKKSNITKLYAVPTVYIRLLALSNLKEKLCSIRYCFSAAASMASEHVIEWKVRTGLDIFEAYGMTESASMVTFNHYHRHVVGSVGTPSYNVEVQICDQEGNVLGKNKKGEICISGPNIMKGYLNRPKETRAAFWGRWFRSGDVGMMDDDSYVYIVDRIKELVITGGENVSPREVEEVLYQQHEIEECAVIGLPDKEYGERLVAYIVPKSGNMIDAVRLRVFLKNRLSPFKVPKEFVMVSKLPKSSSGKLLKRELRRQVMEKMSA